MRLVRSALCAAALLGALPALAAEPYVWWEAESPAATNFPAETPFSASTFPAKRALLSGGDWLTNAGPRSGPAAYARWVVQVPEGRTWRLWARKFWKHGPFRWRFDGGEWWICGRDVALADETPIRTHLVANWVFLGEVELVAGARTFEIELLAGEGEERTCAFDCFVLVPGAFQPRGALRPGETSGEADPGRFAWEPDLDPFDGQAALLDLRSLNERTAGEAGFVRRSGDRLVGGDGKPVRFWGVNAGMEIAGLDRASLRAMARGLAKRGVNLVRLHGPVFTDATAQPDPSRVDRVQFLVSALKAEGIYTALSFYFPLWLDASAACGFPEYEGFDQRKPFTLLFFEPRMRGLWRAWASALLGSRNPHGGQPLAKEPAVAMVEILNEDSLFFWTFTRKNVPPPLWRDLERRFAAWAVRRHGSWGAVRAAWVEAREPEDDPGGEAVALYDAWHMTADGLKAAGPGKRARVADQVRFLAETQRGFYEEAVRWLRKDLGVRCAIVCSNWVTADPATLGAIERWTYLAGDVVDGHGYFEPVHRGEGASWSVQVGHEFAPRAAVREPEAVPLRVVQPAGFPAIISELGWTHPNRYRADAALLGAAYGALQGLDGLMWFAVGSPFWETSMGKFALSVPDTLGAFPAAALVYRRGDVAEGPEVHREAVVPDDLLDLKIAGAAAAPALDALRAADAPPEAGGRSPGGPLDPLAFFTGRVTQAYGAAPGSAIRLDLSDLVRRNERVVRSATGELEWDWGRGLVTVRTKRTEAAAGFLSQFRRIELSVAAIECENEYACVVVTALDDRPLSTARRILVQATTPGAPRGFRGSGGWEGRISDLGGPPWNVERVRARVTLALAPGPIRAIQALDANGYPRPGVSLAPTGGGESGEPLSFRLPEDGLYTVILR